MLPSQSRGRPRRGRGGRTRRPAGHNASTMPDTTIIATRESRLALWQAEHVRDLLQSRFGLRVELLGMTTRGDQILDRALSKVGGKGLFVKELETALEDGRAAPGRALAEGRADGAAGRLRAGRGARARRPARRLRLPALRHAAELPQGACVGTSSLRRVAQLLGAAARPAHRAAARQPRHPAAQARRRRLRRHRAGRRRAEAAGPGRAHRARCSTPRR